MAYRLYKIRLLAILLSLLICTIAAQRAKAQNTTSPYSILGIGDIDTRYTGRYFISGSAALSRRNSAIYNDANPASLTSLAIKVVNLDLTGNGKAGTFISGSADTLSATSKDFIIKRASFALRPHPRTAFAFGLKPYSSVNYKYTLPPAVYNTQANGYTPSVEGTGGINQVYGSAAYMLGKKISAGITASYLFGTVQKNTTYMDESLNLDILKEAYSFYKGFNVLAGMQYYSAPNKKWRHTAGLTFSAGTALKGYSKTEYINSDSSFLQKSNGSSLFKMPVAAGLGYTASNKQGLSVSIEGNYYYWPRQTLSYTNTYTSPSMRFSAGWEYTSMGKYSFEDISYEKFYIGMGITAQNSYYHLQGNKIWDYSVTLGGGYNLSGSLYLHSGLCFGIKGQKSLGQIQERYTQFTLGVTIRNIWYRSNGMNND